MAFVKGTELFHSFFTGFTRLSVTNFIRFQNLTVCSWDNVRCDRVAAYLVRINWKHYELETLADMFS